MTQTTQYTEERHLVIYGYTRQDLEKLMKHFESCLPPYIKLSFHTKAECTDVHLTGTSSGLELLRFNINKYHNMLAQLFAEEVLAMDKVTIPQILAAKLLEKELTISTAESCTGGNIAHKIVLNSGSSAYFLGSVVSYSNDVKASVLGVPRSLIDRYGAVSREVVESMANGACRLMRTNCAIATSGIAGPHGGSPAKPVGTVWFAVKYGDTVVSDVRHFKGDRNTVIESASNHGMVMLINLLRHAYTSSEYAGDE